MPVTPISCSSGLKFLSEESPLLWQDLAMTKCNNWIWTKGATNHTICYGNEPFYSNWHVSQFYFIFEFVCCAKQDKERSGAVCF